ncbi:MAG TPA: hypothetical protein VG097_14190 [Gemmata sp.]|nr:hypothetical protein [Gemmata sp.]
MVSLFAQGWDMPDWLISVLIQYPIVVVIGFVAWYSYREVRQNNTEHNREVRQKHEKEIENLKEAHERLIATKDAEIGRVTKEMKVELGKLTKTVAEWNKRLEP